VRLWPTFQCRSEIKIRRLTNDDYSCYLLHNYETKEVIIYLNGINKFHSASSHSAKISLLSVNQRLNIMDGIKPRALSFSLVLYIRLFDDHYLRMIVLFHNY